MNWIDTRYKWREGRGTVDLGDGDKSAHAVLYVHLRSKVLILRYLYKLFTSKFQPSINLLFRVPKMPKQYYYSLSLQTETSTQ